MLHSQDYDVKPSDLTLAELEALTRRARRLRAEALRDMAGALRRRLFGPDRRQEALSALTALRSAAEALRDHPETPGDQRRRLLDIVLAEESRLERLFNRPA